MSKAENHLDPDLDPGEEESARPTPPPGTQQFVPGLGQVTVGDLKAPAETSAETGTPDNTAASAASDTPDSKGPRMGGQETPANSQPQGEAERENNPATGTGTGASQVENEQTEPRQVERDVNCGIEDSAEPLLDDLAAVQEQRIAELQEELARANAAYYNLEQEYSAYVRRSKSEIPAHRQTGVAEVVNALIGVLDDIALARTHEDLTGTFKAVATKMESTLEGKFQVRRFGEVGQAFDPALHQAIQMLDGTGENSTEEQDTVIVQVAQPGYLHGDKVLRPAMVIAGHGKISTEPTVLPGSQTPGKENQ